MLGEQNILADCGRKKIFRGNILGEKIYLGEKLLWAKKIILGVEILAKEFRVKLFWANF